MNWKVWLLGIVHAVISGLANGVMTGLAAVGIAPDTFNLDKGFHATLMMAGAGAVFGAITGVAGFLRQSPLPAGWDGVDRRNKE